LFVVPTSVYNATVLPEDDPVRSKHVVDIF
jgi:hypothetical protein